MFKIVALLVQNSINYVKELHKIVIDFEVQRQ